MKTTLPTAAEWKELGFDVPVQLCSSHTVYPPHMPADNAKIVAWIDRKLYAAGERAIEMQKALVMSPVNAESTLMIYRCFTETVNEIIFAGQVRQALVNGSLVIHDHTELFEP